MVALEATMATSRTGDCSGPAREEQRPWDIVGDGRTEEEKVHGGFISGIISIQLSKTFAILATTHNNQSHTARRLATSTSNRIAQAHSTSMSCNSTPVNSTLVSSFATSVFVALHFRPRRWAGSCSPPESQCWSTYRSSLFCN